MHRLYEEEMHRPIKLHAWKKLSNIPNGTVVKFENSYKFTQKYFTLLDV